jgi:phosphoglycolate phosphatase-like HAD superfamily hydrolase
MIRLVLFDIDGTLIHTGGAGVRAFSEAFAEEFGLADADKKLSFSGRTDTGLALEFFRTHGREPDAAELNRFFAGYLRRLELHLHSLQGGVFPGVTRWLEDLAAHPSAPVTGLLTGNLRAGAERKLRRYDLWESFSLGAFADGHAERDAIAGEALATGRQRLGAGLAGEEILVIGDTPLDVRCARAIGAKALAVGTGGATMEALHACAPDWLARDLEEISVADVLGTK